MVVMFVRGETVFIVLSQMVPYGSTITMCRDSTHNVSPYQTAYPRERNMADPAPYIHTDWGRHLLAITNSTMVFEIDYRQRKIKKNLLRLL